MLRVLLLCVKWLIVECDDRMTRPPDLWMNLFLVLIEASLGSKLGTVSLSGECYSVSEKPD